jgi:hypothetical protein
MTLWEMTNFWRLRNLRTNTERVMYHHRISYRIRGWDR